MKNPREAFGAIVAAKLEEREESQNAFSLRLAPKLGIKTKFSGYVSNVVKGAKVPPVEDLETWAKVLGIDPDSGEGRAFKTAHAAALAWGKSDGRDHLARQDAEIRRLRAALGRAEAHQERLSRRIAELEAALKGR